MPQAPHPTGMNAWNDLLQVAECLAIDPSGLGGASLRSLPGPLRDGWLAHLQGLLPTAAPIRRIPAHVSDDRLLGGLDFVATLRARRPVVALGLLAEVDNGVAVLAMAERIALATIAKIVSVADVCEVVLERDGLTERHPARFGIVALDEGLGEQERPAAALLDRLAFHLDLSTLDLHAKPGRLRDAPDITAARAIYPLVSATDEVVASLSTAALTLGISSIRAPLLALRVARALAALAGRLEVEVEDATAAARWVLGPRATMLPAGEPSPEEPASERSTGAPPLEEERDQVDRNETPADRQTAIEDTVTAAARAAIPAGLLAVLRDGVSAQHRMTPAGKAGFMQQASKGRPAGARPGRISSGVRLNVIETLRAAAPWQRIRRDVAVAANTAIRVFVSPEDFRITRYRHRSQTITIFLLDASGSSALQRLAEAKGAIELLLGESYARRDQVAVIAFRGRGAEIVLPPTRALARAKRTLAGLPGGGGTPLAAAIDAGAVLADSLCRRGMTPTLVLLTDGRANIARSGAAGRVQAESDALSAARRVRAARTNALLVDTSQRPQAIAQRLAAELGARYVPLPYADPQHLARSVQSARRDHS